MYVESPVEVLPQLLVQGGKEFGLEDGLDEGVVLIVDLQDQEVVLCNKLVCDQFPKLEEPKLTCLVLVVICLMESIGIRLLTTSITWPFLGPFLMFSRPIRNSVLLVKMRSRLAACNEFVVNARR